VKNNNIIINCICTALMGLMFFGAMGDVAYAATSQNCPITPVTVVNQSIHTVVLQGVGDPVIIPPKSAIATTVQSKYFYSRCGLIHLSLDQGNPKSGLIADKATKIQISIRPNDKIDQIGMTSQGFDLDEYISWHGYKEVLSLGLKIEKLSVVL
jgi:hypothetical protein